MKSTRAVPFLVVLALSSCCFAQDEPHRHDAEGKLGTVSFPISRAPSTQAQFERGVALLYPFEYEQASDQFEEIEKREPGCALANWGHAMSSRSRRPQSCWESRRLRSSENGRRRGRGWGAK